MKTHNNTPVSVGPALLHTPAPDSEPTGEFITREEHRFYRIRNSDRMDPFFMTVVSPSDHWMFIGSNGALTAGRRNSHSSLFPYYTSDKVLDGNALTGPLTRLLVERNGRRQLWAPFAAAYEGIYATERNLYKSASCDTVLFEEVNYDVQLTFSYAWSFSERCGFVRRCRLINHGEACPVYLLDGVQNLLPHGVEPDGQNLYSNLLDAYKRAELQAESKLAVYGLSSRLTDKAEPSEALRAHVAWAAGLPESAILLSTRQVASFTRSGRLEQETEVCGERCAFLLNTELALAANSAQDWLMVFELNQDHTAVANLAARLCADRPAMRRELEEDVAASARNLEAIVASVDGLQRSGAETTGAHHYANVLLNTMRGGVYADGYRLQRDEVARYVSSMNAPVYEAHRAVLERLPATVTIEELKAAADASESSDFQRLCRQYLPLTFSRRHGDPSRPWNHFSINVRNPDGSKRLDYQGNWRDIFQNWEALNLSYPGFFESSICVFLNFTTADGYNPYRVSREGLDWERPEPHNPWANIGYWGDHQIIYLLKLLEWCEAFQSETLARLLDRPLFSHAQVPYKIRAYEAILADPFNTIEFDHALDADIEKRVKRTGHDGRLLTRADGSVVHATLVEKLLILLLAKLSNYIPGAGIWMNTQRPEWNDANNALVGRGVSVVTLGYLRRFTAFLLKLLPATEGESFAVESSLATFFGKTEDILTRHEPQEASLDPQARRRVMDELGRAGSAYRTGYYQNGLSSTRISLTHTRLDTFLKRTLAWMDEGLRVNRREDGLYHAYNTLTLGPQATEITRLKEMLEGQVSIISSGSLSHEEVLATLQALRRSALYREDQHSYMLYPNVRPPGFLHKNTLPAERVASDPLLLGLLERGDTRFVTKDQAGAVHFQGDLRNRTDVLAALKSIAASGVTVDEASRHRVVALFEDLFDHTRYTGRSGTFFAYEGLGSIYWHMVAKLLLAVQEVYFDAVEKKADSRTCFSLFEHYYDIRAGLGFNKTPTRYGAFPTDPYSHTPWGKGAQQPGMTGQVKEEVLTRLGELGLRIRGGALHFEPTLLRGDEWLNEADTLSYVDTAGNARTIPLPANSLGFTYCQVPFIFIRSAKRCIEIRYSDGTSRTTDGASCGPDASHHITSRDGRVASLNIHTNSSYD